MGQYGRTAIVPRGVTSDGTPGNRLPAVGRHVGEAVDAHECELQGDCPARDRPVPTSTSADTGASSLGRRASRLPNANDDR